MCAAVGLIFIFLFTLLLAATSMYQVAAEQEEAPHLNLKEVSFSRVTEVNKDLQLVHTHHLWRHIPHETDYVHRALLQWCGQQNLHAALFRRSYRCFFEHIWYIGGGAGMTNVGIWMEDLLAIHRCVGCSLCNQSRRGADDVVRFSH
jgi:hypothetical protein